MGRWVELMSGRVRVMNMILVQMYELEQSFF